MKKYFYTTICALIFGCTAKCYAQSDIGVHFISNLLQASNTNPAMVPYGIYTALPSGMINLYHSQGSLSNLLNKEGSAQYLDLSKMKINAEDDYFLLADASAELFQFSWLQNKVSWSVGYNYDVKNLIKYPGSLADVLINGNDHLLGKEVDTYVQAQSQWYHQYYFGLGYHVPYFSIGTRIKVLSGIYSLNTITSTGTLLSDAENFATKLDFNHVFNASGDLLDYNADTRSFSINETATSSQFLGKNFGLGIDIGIKLSLSEIFFIDASFLNIGQINWRNNTRQYSWTQNKIYEGISISPPFESDPISFTQIVDSLESLGDIQVEQITYNTDLFPQLFLGFQYQMTDRTKIGLIYSKEYNRQKLFPLLATHFAYNLDKIWEVGVTWSTKHGRFDNLGLHTLLSLGPIQLFATTDNIFQFPLFRPWSNFHFRGGLNIRFNYSSI